MLYVTESHGRVLAEDVPAKDPLPPFPASIKDGYAVLGQYTFTINALHVVLRPHGLIPQLIVCRGVQLLMVLA